MLTPHHQEIAKGHTDASASTRMTAAKDAVSDKIDEQKHDVSLPTNYPSPRSPTASIHAYVVFLNADQSRRLRQQVGTASYAHPAAYHSFVFSQ